MNTVFPDVADSKLSGVRLNTAAEAAVIDERRDRIDSFIVGFRYSIVECIMNKVSGCVPAFQRPEF